MSASKQRDQDYKMWTGRSFSDDSTLIMWPINDESMPGSATVLSPMDALIQAITEQTKAITLLAESNQMLIQAMADQEGVEEADRYRTL